MKILRFIIIALLCAVAQGAWAQTSVSTEQALRSAIADGANIQLTADINITSLLEIPGNYTVTIDLNSHTLNRGLTQRANAGQVITVRTGATLNLSNGTLTGGFGGNGRCPGY